VQHQKPVPFAAVLFDCDGVLVDSEPITNGVLREMLIELGWDISVEECLDRFVGRALRDEFGVITEHTGFIPDTAWYEEFRDRRNAALTERLEAVPHVDEVVRAVHAAYGEAFAVASGADRAKVEMQLDKTGLLPDFGDRIFSGMETPRSKPAPDVYLLAASTLGVDPAGCAVVEDTVPGVQAGVAAGATVIAFAPEEPGRAPASELLAAGASQVVTDMRVLTPILLG
jgi:HAD superfamily hydrolase (TIGR01509 family)